MAELTQHDEDRLRSMTANDWAVARWARDWVADAALCPEDLDHRSPSR